MLREIGDLELGRAGDRAVLTAASLAGEQLDQRRLAVAVGAKQRDAVVIVDAQRQAAQHRPARLVADRDVVEWR